MVVVNSLDPVEARVVGVLVEKQMTTPDVYPLTLAGVVAGCNQSTNRRPVMAVDDDEVERALVRLHDAGWATPVRRPGDRATKYRHKVAEALEVDRAAQAVLAVLLLRGSQTSGEVRSRTDRYLSFGSLDEVETVLDALEEQGLVRRLPRLPGQSQRRIVELLSAEADAEGGVSVPPLAEEAPATAPSDLVDRLAALEERFDELLRRLGETDL